MIDARARAQRRLPRLAFDFIDGGAGGEQALRANRDALDGLTLQPRYLRDVSKISRGVTVVGREIAGPVLIAPTGMACLAGPGGDIAGARAAHAAGTVFVLSTMSNHSIEAVAAAVPGSSVWFQLYLWRQRDLVEALVDRAARAGLGALIVTIDVPAVGQRLRDLRNGFSVPPRLTRRTAVDMLRHPRWLRGMWPPPTFVNVEQVTARSAGAIVGHANLVNTLLSNPGATWDDLDWLRQAWKGPLLVKGVLTAEDGAEAVRRGADGVIVSNHGGRQLASAPATIDVLPDVVAAVAGRADVLMDGGIRDGEDVVKAIALGAGAVLIGRPWLYSLAVGGQAGVTEMLESLYESVERALALVGVPRLGDLDASVVSRREPRPSAHGGVR